VGFVYTVKSDKKIIGAISGFGRVILTLVVDPAWQRKGIGTKLMQKVAGNILVYTEACSIGFYQKLGFKRIFTIGRTIFLWRS
jgi:ribosomal protein S18 acetylase RimI-like enzyme